jgi:tRNA pseudouridine55 synthase
MSHPNRRRREVHGILLLDKPRGMTSNQALQRVKRLYGAAKAGHTGSLDPLATGMLPICFGEATKLTGFMLAADKCYEVTARLGIATDSGDADGRVIGEVPVPVLSDEAVREALARFIGKIDQIPPMYSALKHDGHRLYELARRGIEVCREARSVEIKELTLLRRVCEDLEFSARCSKGTYIRTLVEDVARSLGSVGHVTELRRLAVEPFSGHAMVTLAELETSPTAALDERLLPVDSALADWPQLIVDPEDAQRLTQGQTVAAEPSWPQTRVRLYAPGRRFFGIGEILPHRRLVPKRIFPALSPWS